MELRAPAYRGAARVKAVRAPRAAGSWATPPRPARDRAAETAGAGQAEKRTAVKIPSAPTFRIPLCAPGPSSPWRLGPRTRAGRRSQAQQLLERQLTQAPGARADVTPGHVCGRPGARGLAEPPCDGARAPPDSSWQCRGPPSAGASCTDCGPSLRQRACPSRRGGAGSVFPGRGGRPSGRRRRSCLATPHGATLTRARGSNRRDNFRRVGGLDGGRGGSRAPLE